LKEKEHDNEYNEMHSSVLNLHGRLFTFVNSLVTTLETTKFTPFRSNLFTIGQILELHHEDLMREDEEENINFARKFWISCSCSKSCHLSVLFRDALHIHQAFRNKTKIKFFKRLEQFC